MSRQEADKLIDEILNKKPSLISPTLPPLNDVGLDSLRTDSLDLDTLSVGPITRSSAKEKAAKSRSTSGSNTPKTSVRKRLSGPMTTTSPITSKASTSNKVEKFLDLMIEIHKKEQYSDTIEEWRNLIKSIEMAGTMECANSPRNTEFLAT